ncbi:NAD(P)-dependent dehydrogenase (short-subunit alcohol dehydrogenase family) [Microbacterium immunditiarum]|uniref:NAD(P)-dependent dehydrogenase (Short-subunit alcohol dehydrogenase family) n=1 Tax=Microbacterium immunditiarum TaxID=337480 RepID=A0A7Y9GMG6_9MICO|nr:NAD(P)-dependent dehydrogenase (short-subunit alcohol dehydrogenase family) [Microbacterium immunditiarum]
MAIIDREVGAPDDLLLEADVTDGDSVKAAIDFVGERYGRIDVVVNNAGIGASGDVEANTIEEWNHVFDVNVVGIVRVTRAALPWLRNSASGSVVNTASVAGLTGLRDRVLYSATKGAVVAMTYAMAADLVAEGIRVNAVAPGTTDTPWVERLLSAAPTPEAAAKALRTRQPIGRLVTPDEVAFAITNLSSPRAASTTGTVQLVDGGLLNLLA